MENRDDTLSVVYDYQKHDINKTRKGMFKCRKCHVEVLTVRELLKVACLRKYCASPRPAQDAEKEQRIWGYGPDPGEPYMGGVLTRSRKSRKAGA